MYKKDKRCYYRTIKTGRIGNGTRKTKRTNIKTF